MDGVRAHQIVVGPFVRPGNSRRVLRSSRPVTHSLSTFTANSMNIRTLSLSILSLLLMPLAASSGQSQSDSAAIRQTALDYIQGWYAGDATRMERAVHPELAKRIVRVDTLGNYRLDQMSAMSLVQGTRNGYGKTTPQADRHDDVRILDIYRNAASVRIDASSWIDYLQVAKWHGRWVIVNVLWELKPKA